MEQTSSLMDWKDISCKFRDHSNDGTLWKTDGLGLLLGNGLSTAIWRNFGYDSLYQVACNTANNHYLTDVDQKLFRYMETNNFEQVLSALAITKSVCGHLEKEFGDVDDRYESVRNSLIEAVRTVHVPYDRMKSSIKSRLARLISKYRYVYTTNYDLLPYWATRELEETDPKRRDSFKDFFWAKTNESNLFDISDANEWDKPATTYILYLHGALHLEHNSQGDTRKRTFNKDHSIELLDQFATSQDWIPLFVSEGNSKEKLRRIGQNEYLSFAYWKLRHHRGPLVIFGSGLSSDFDQHIIGAIKNWQAYDRRRNMAGRKPAPRKIAISIHKAAASDSDIIILKSRLNEAFGRQYLESRGLEIYYFDSTTHPLGNPKLSVDTES